MLIDLSGVWELRDETGEFQAAMTLPGDIISGLCDAGLIKDPYYGRNEYDLRWIADRDWTLRRTFEADGGEYAFSFSQIDTVAEIRLNGDAVLKSDNAFRRYRQVLAVADGPNTMEILLKSPTRAANAIQNSQPYFVPYTQNYPVPNGNMLRKPQCDFGWDWNAALMPSGVYGAITAVPAGPIHISDILIRQRQEDDCVHLDITALVESTIDYESPFQFEIDGALAEGKTTLRPGENRVSVVLSVDDPKLWWPAGQGNQPLYDLKVSVCEAQTSRRIGLRDMELVSEPDEIGRSLKLRVNGRDIFCKGANWIPQDALAGRTTPEATRDLLQSAVDANMNMIRVWGGGWYEPDWFYDICDELGIMIWQDAMFSCSLYPATEEFLAEVEKEIIDNGRRLQHRTCLALWCGDNELIGALTWYDESIKDRDRYLVAYDRLNRVIETALKSVDPEVNWWPSSPSPGPLSFGDAWHDDTAGDMHFWSVWHEGRDFDHYRDVSPRFCSEFGFQSYPSIDVIRKFAEGPDLNIASPVMESHQKNEGGNARIAETMFRYYRFPEGFENFVYLSQVQQAEAIGIAVTHWRTLKPHCMGALFWQLNDTWPVASWASLDHGGGWKLLHHAAKQFFAPVLVTAVPGDEAFAIRAVNDAPQSSQVSVTLRAVSVSGQVRDMGGVQTTLETDAIEIARIDQADLSADEILVIDWQVEGQNAGRELCHPKPFKDYVLLAADLSLDVSSQNGVHSLRVSANSPAFFVALEANVPGRFCSNAFHLLPGEVRTVTFSPTDPKAVPNFVLRDLHSATYA